MSHWQIAVSPCERHTDLESSPGITNANMYVRLLSWTRLFFLKAAVILKGVWSFISELRERKCRNAAVSTESHGNDNKHLVLSSLYGDEVKLHRHCNLTGVTRSTWTSKLGAVMNDQEMDTVGERRVIFRRRLLENKKHLETTSLCFYLLFHACMHMAYRSTALTKLSQAESQTC